MQGVGHIFNTLECWSWCGSRTNGHPTIYVEGRSVYARRELLSLFGVTVSSQQKVRMSCNTGNCINPKHMSVVGLGVNTKHYKGTPTERFWLRVNKVVSDPCWIWTASLDEHGYGKFWNGNRVEPAHRFAFRDAHVIAEESAEFRKLLVRHHCDNPPCVNPSHLTVGTYKDNSEDMVSRGRSMRGEQHVFAILCEADIHDIFALRKEGCLVRELAEEFGVCAGTISDVINRRTWKHVQVRET